MMSVRAVFLGLLVVTTLSLSARAAEDPPPVANPELKILDLIFKVENLAGAVQDFQIEETDLEIRIELAADVLFDFDQADVRSDAQNALTQAADIVRNKAQGTVRIEGHTDGKGSDSYNQRLSERRANAIKEWFIYKEGLSKVTFSTRGFGARNPVAPNAKPNGEDDPEGRQKNRRVEIVISKKG